MRKCGFLMFLVHSSQGLHIHFFCTCLALQQSLSDESCWIDIGTLWCIQWRRITPSYHLCCLADVQCNVLILFFFIYHRMKVELLYSRIILRSSFVLAYDAFQVLARCKSNIFVYVFNSFLVFRPILGAHGVFLSCVILTLIVFLFGIIVLN